MKKLITTLILFALLSLNTKETNPKEGIYYYIGKFIVVKDSQGYQAMTGGRTSLHYNTMYRSLKELL